jgi:hypothetical protein
MAEVVRCTRCSSPIPRPVPLGHGLRGVSVCPICKALVVSEQGEMSAGDRADRDEWGPLGFQ